MSETASTRTVLVTGSSRGIGRAVALSLADAGYDVVVHCRASRAQAEEVCREIEAKGRKARLLTFDVTDREAARETLAADCEAHGAYWGVVLNAGIHRDAPLVGLEEDDWDSVLKTDLDAFYNVLKPVLLPMCRKRRGRVVVMSSVSGLYGTRGQTNYSAAKAGLIGAAKALAMELASRGITVNAVAPVSSTRAWFRTKSANAFSPSFRCAARAVPKKWPRSCASFSRKTPPTSREASSPSPEVSDGTRRHHRHGLSLALGQRLADRARSPL